MCVWGKVKKHAHRYDGEERRKKSGVAKKIAGVGFKEEGLCGEWGHVGGT